MATDPSNLLGTPQGYATPEQIKNMYEYSKYLGQGDAQFPVITKWSQGVSNMVNALMSGWLSNRANSMQRGTQQYDVNQRNFPSAPVYSPTQTNQQMPYVSGVNMSPNPDVGSNSIVRSLGFG